MGLFGRAAAGIARFGQHVGSMTHKFGHAASGVVRKIGQGVATATKVAHGVDRALGGVLSKNPYGAAAFAVAHKVPGYAKKTARFLDKVSGYGEDVAEKAKGYG